MTKYLISFPSGAMAFPDEDLQAASHAVVQEAKEAGVWVFGGGIDESIPPVMVEGDGTVTDGTYPQTQQLEGGYTILELPAVPRGSPGVGRENRGRVPMRSGGPSVPGRSRQLTGFDLAGNHIRPRPDPPPHPSAIHVPQTARGCRWINRVGAGRMPIVRRIQAILIALPLHRQLR